MMTEQNLHRGQLVMGDHTREVIGPATGSIFTPIARASASKIEESVFSASPACARRVATSFSGR
jgi:acyl-CoA reductase-like NAD-dependent aldehyde dehydrogenase